MLQRGEHVPHFQVNTTAGQPISYAAIWQRRSLVLITVPDTDSHTVATFLSRLEARLPELTSYEADCVITRDAIPGLPSPGAAVADRWGEIAFVKTGSDITALPDPDELVDWLRYLQNRCPECEGEAR